MYILWCQCRNKLSFYSGIIFVNVFCSNSKRNWYKNFWSKRLTFFLLSLLKKTANLIPHADKHYLLIFGTTKTTSAVLIAWTPLSLHTYIQGSGLLTWHCMKKNISEKLWVLKNRKNVTFVQIRQPKDCKTLWKNSFMQLRVLNLMKQNICIVMTLTMVSRGLMFRLSSARESQISLQGKILGFFFTRI